MKENIRQVNDRTVLSLESALHDCAQLGYQQSRAAVEFLYKRFYGYLFAITLRYVKNREDAEELVNESFVKAFEKIRTFVGKGSKMDDERMFRAWLARICVNASIDFLRSKRAMYSLDEEEESDFSEHLKADSAADAELNVEDIRALLFKLPDVQRTIFNLFEVEGYSHDEIGQLLDIPTSTSRTYLTRAKDRLRSLYLQRNLTPVDKPR